MDDVDHLIVEKRTKASNKLKLFACQQRQMRRIGTAQEVAATVLWLCSNQASFITGATIPSTAAN